MRWNERSAHDDEAEAAHDTLELTPSSSFALGGSFEDLINDVDDFSRRRLLNFLLGFCRKAFDLADDADFAGACRQLARLCAADAGVAEPIATVTRAWTVVRGPTLAAETPCFVLTPRRVSRSRIIGLPELDGYCAVERIAEGDILLITSEHPQRWTVGAAPRPTRDLILPQPDFAALRSASLRALAPACPSVASTLRETVLLAPAAPIRHDDPRHPIGGALELALPDGEGRLFLRGWLRDPMQLVQSVWLRTPCGDVAVPNDHLFRHRRPDVDQRFGTSPFVDADRRAGFVAFTADPSHGACPQPTLELRLRSGTRIPLVPNLRNLDTASSRTAILTSVPASYVSDQMLDQCIGPAAAALHRQLLSSRSTPDIIEIGRQPENPAVTIIVPLYKNLTFLRFQIAALASDPQCRACELIIVLDSPGHRLEAEHLLRGMHAMHDRPIRLIILPRNLGYAAANNEGARFATGQALLLLNSDVVPSAQGWLAPLEAALALPNVGVVGPKLLLDDGSIQHAGLYFRRDVDDLWLNAHYYKGMPRHWPAAAVARDVPGVTGAALMVRRSVFEAVGGICEDYIVGDYEDSDFCLRVRERNLAIRYVPSAELYHFERKSIQLHGGYVNTLACRYNRRLHHCHWHSAIEGVMAQTAAAAPVGAVA